MNENRGIGLAKAAEFGDFKYLECSSKNMEGVTDVFISLLGINFIYSRINKIGLIKMGRVYGYQISFVWI